MSGLFSLEGTVAVVTGAAGGIGAAIAEGLAGAGAYVVCADAAEESNQALVQRLGADRVEAVTVDVCDEESVRALADRAGAVSGSVDVLVNCAGIGGRDAAATYDDELWARVIDVNLTGSFRTCRAIGRRMAAQPQGASIVNIASILGEVGFAGSVGYQASKGGVVQMTRTLAVEWAPHGVRVNAISPGHVGTPLVRRLWETEPELKDHFESRTPLGRLAEPSDMVGAVVFLASPASAMVTGQILAVDGGYTAQ